MLPAIVDALCRIQALLLLKAPIGDRRQLRSKSWLPENRGPTVRAEMEFDWLAAASVADEQKRGSRYLCCLCEEEHSNAESRAGPALALQAMAKQKLSPVYAWRRLIACRKNRLPFVSSASPSIWSAKLHFDWHSTTAWTAALFSSTAKSR